MCGTPYTKEVTVPEEVEEQGPEGEWDFPASGVTATFINEGFGGEGWVLYDSGTYRVMTMDDEGNLELVIDILAYADAHPEEEDWPDGSYPMGFKGVVAHPDGYYLMSGIDRLIRITTDGEMDYVATWTVVDPVLNEDDEFVEPWEILHDIAPLDITINRHTAEVALFGYFGGFATWTAEDGLDILQEDHVVFDPVAFGLEQPYAFLFHSRVRDDGAFYSLGYHVEEERFGVFRWNKQNQKVATKALWSTSTPGSLGEGHALDSFASSVKSFVIDDETGDFYMTTNAATYNEVWKMFDEDGYSTQLYSYQWSGKQKAFYGLMPIWNEVTPTSGP